MDFIISNNALLKYCGSSSEVFLPSVHEIGESAFYLNNTVQHVFIPNGVVRLRPWSFGYCNMLKTVHIPRSVVEIHSSAFDGSQSLEKIIIDPDSPYFSSDDGILFDKEGKRLLLYPRGKREKRISIKNPVVCIADNAFNRASFIEDIEISDSVETIGYKAFAYCTSLYKIRIPESIKEIGYCAFANCNNIKEFVVDTNNYNYSASDGCLLSKDGTRIIQFPLGKEIYEFLVEKEISKIEERAFSCSKIARIKVSKNNDYFMELIQFVSNYVILLEILFYLKS